MSSALADGTRGCALLNRSQHSNAHLLAKAKYRHNPTSANPNLFICICILMSGYRPRGAQRNDSLVVAMPALPIIPEAPGIDDS